jgi:protein SCO1/2
LHVPAPAAATVFSMRSIKKILIVGGILLLPGLFYLLLIKGKNHYERLAIFGPRHAATATVGGTDTVYHTIPDFTLTDQSGESLDAARIRGHIVVVDFFFATCQTICPDMSAQLHRVQTAFKDDPDVLLLSHSVDPARDTVEALMAYAKHYKAIAGKWYFVTGDKKAIYDLARKGYFVSATEGNGGPDDFIHSDQLILLDKESRIRGYYDGTDPYEVNRLIDEIVVLKQEYKEKGAPAP